MACNFHLSGNFRTCGRTAMYGLALALPCVVMCQSCTPSGTAIVTRPSSEPMFVFEGTPVYRIPGSRAYAYVTGFMTIDADGAPKAYHPQDTGLDELRNAGYPQASWWKNVLVTDPERPDRPFVMKTGPYAGYFLSMTSLKDYRKSVTDPARYVDASRVPYIVFPVRFSEKEGVGGLGDFGMAVNLATNRQVGFVVADIGPRNHPLGEVSIRLAEMLGGIHVSARTGLKKPLGDILYIVFPGSGRRYPWPQRNNDIKGIARRELAAVGGMSAVGRVLGLPKINEMK